MIQGLTEFLPISSSGHLVIVQQLMGIEAPGSFLLDFDLILHVGTLVSILVALYQEVWEILKSWGQIIKALWHRRKIDWAETYQHSPGIKLTVMIVVGTIPAVILGLLFRDALEGLFMSLWGAGCMLLVPGGILWLSKYFRKSSRPFSEVGLFQSFLVGIAQSIALIPGISRSGITIVTALGLRWNRELAAKFSFLLLIPAILGGVVLEWQHIGSYTGSEKWIMFWGGLVAAITGFFTIKLLVYIVKKGNLKYFSYYCWGVGALTVLYVLGKNFL